LNSILLLSRVLADNQDNELTEDHVESAQAIYSSGSDLLSLINDILDLSKVESGKMELHVEEVNLEDLAGSLERTFRPLAEDKKLSLTVEVVDGLPKSIETDRQRMEQIVKNFFTNALKFTSKGSITLSIGRPDDASGFDPKRTVSFSVIDTGIGIAEDKQKQIFEALQQADGTTSRKYGGTGLGLSIAKELAGFMGGKIRLKSREGGGSTFALYLPEEMEAGREQRA
ncbi:MAG TPA: histidine kinase, partial [Deltaproteobacteria bacterium]|nr:histidine kinase [Deltaproteobacteria bacterium]